MNPHQLSAEDKSKLRKIKGVAGHVQDIARNTMVPGNTDQGAYIQFGRDLATYNLLEALMYAQNYEDKGMYAEGTVAKATAAALKVAT